MRARRHLSGRGACTVAGGVATLVAHAILCVGGRLIRSIIPAGCGGFCRFLGEHLVILGVDTIGFALVDNAPLVQQIISILERDDVLLLELPRRVACLIINAHTLLRGVVIAYVHAGLVSRFSEPILLQGRSTI